MCQLNGKNLKTKRGRKGTRKIYASSHEGAGKKSRSSDVAQSTQTTVAEGRQVKWRGGARSPRSSRIASFDLLFFFFFPVVYHLIFNGCMFVIGANRKYQVSVVYWLAYGLRPLLTIQLTCCF